MSGASRNKGARGENEVLELIRAGGWPRATRNFASGAAGNSDIAHGPAGTVFEIKRTERFELRKTWRQVEQDARRAGSGILPIIATRWSGNASGTPPWLAVTELDELLILLHLRETG